MTFCLSNRKTRGIYGFCQYSGEPLVALDAGYIVCNLKEGQK